MIRTGAKVLELVTTARRRELAERRQQAADIVTVRRAMQGIGLAKLVAPAPEHRHCGPAADS